MRLLQGVVKVPNVVKSGESRKERALRWQRERDSFAPVWIDMKLGVSPLMKGKLFGEKPVGELIDLEPYHYFQSMTVSQPRGGDWTGNLTLFDEDGDFLETLAVFAGTQAELFIRWGWENYGRLPHVPTWKFAVSGLDTEFTAEGITVSMDLVTAGTIERSLDKARGKQTTLADTKKTMSEWFEVLAKDNGWEPDLLYVEPSFDKKFQLAIARAGEMDIAEFIRTQMIPFAISPSGEKFMYYEGRIGDHHFHSPSWFARQEATEKTVKDADANKVKRSYVFTRDEMGEVISFAPSDHFFFNALRGSFCGAVRAVESKKGEETKVRIGASTDADTRAGGVDGEAVGAVGKHERKTPSMYMKDHDPSKQEASFQAVPSRDEATTKMLAKAYHTKARESGLHAQLEVKGTHGIGLNDYVKVEYYTRQGKPHHLAGIYQVFGIEHVLGGGGWVLSLDLTRQGVKYEPKDAKKPVEMVDHAAPLSEVRDTTADEWETDG